MAPFRDATHLPSSFMGRKGGMVGIELTSDDRIQQTDVQERSTHQLLTSTSTLLQFVMSIRILSSSTPNAILPEDFRVSNHLWVGKFWWFHVVWFLGSFVIEVFPVVCITEL